MLWIIERILFKANKNGSRISFAHETISHATPWIVLFSSFAFPNGCFCLAHVSVGMLVTWVVGIKVYTFKLFHEAPTEAKYKTFWFSSHSNNMNDLAEWIKIIASLRRYIRKTDGKVSCIHEIQINCIERRGCWTKISKRTWTKIAEDSVIKNTVTRISECHSIWFGIEVAVVVVQLGSLCCTLPMAWIGCV